MWANDFDFLIGP